MTTITSPNTYGDFAGLEELKSQAAARKSGATPEAARQFEALFVQMMLKSMREASDVLGDGSDKNYRDMFDQQISVEMTKGKGLGLAEMLSRQLSTTSENAGNAPSIQALDAADRSGRLAASPDDVIRRVVHIAARLPAPVLDGILPSVEPPATDVAAVTTASAAATEGNRSVPREDWRPDTALDFLRDLLPHAQKAASELGVSVRALLAHAALETGWGQSVIRDSEGRSTNNLFNIKAGAQWAGEQVRVKTLEYAHGVAEQKTASFRAYPNLAAAFGDYVRLLSDSPRYAAALRAATTPEGFADSLQKAGYATDPDYAAKLRSILTGPRFNGLIAELKNLVQLPIR